jgi:hypothetical protein
MARREKKVVGGETAVNVKAVIAEAEVVKVMATIASEKGLVVTADAVVATRGTPVYQAETKIVRA